MATDMSSSQMSSLPPELLDLIMAWTVRNCRCEKNLVLPLRLVAKAWNTALSPYVLKTIQLEFSKFVNTETYRPSLKALNSMGGFCRAIYLDMMVVRDEEEVTRLGEVFKGIIPMIPELAPLLSSLKQYCMSDQTFDESDFTNVVKGVMDSTPNLERLKINLPFQVVGHASSTATLFLATTLSCLAKRPEDSKSLETFVLDHVSDTTIINLCNNPIDARNALDVFAGLKTLIISIKMQETRMQRVNVFRQNLWFLISKAVGLESLCLVGWNVKRNIKTRIHQHVVSFTEWRIRSLPYPVEWDIGHFPKLRYLELKRVDISPESLLKLIGDNTKSLKEIYLNEVYLKVFGSADTRNTSLWIGYPDMQRSKDCLVIADELRVLQEGPLRLEVLRVTGLGYDDFERDPNPLHANYDLDDPTGHNRSFDQRFVEAVFGKTDSIIKDAPQFDTETSITPLHGQSLQDTLEIPRRPPISHGAACATATNTEGQAIAPPQRLQELGSYDADTYQQQRNTTSELKRCIDGHFFNHNERALKELQRIITVADRGMALVNDELIRAQRLQVTGGTLVSPVVGASSATN